jgi:hypothetical protein
VRSADDARPSRSLRQALALAGLAGFGAAIDVHVAVAVGYTDPLHLVPAVAGAVRFVIGLVFVRERHPREETPWHR